MLDREEVSEVIAFYNEIDPYAAAWLRNLIAAGHIAPGVVDERSIEDIAPEELREFNQCHFFAGIGVWSYALRLAGWPDDRPIWTGSCPCQPFSTAGKGAGFGDERHLWPAFHHLIEFCRPSVVLGEQVASKDGRSWLSLVHTDLEALGYSFGAADMCAAGVGAPHIRQRLYWVAQSNEREWGSRRPGSGEEARPHAESARRSATGIPLAHHHQGLEIGGVESARAECPPAKRGSETGELVNTQGKQAGVSGCPWEPGRIDWIPCRDGKSRPVESGTFPLAHGAPARVGRLRAYGNAIVAPQAEVFVRAYLEAVALQELMQ